MKNDQPTPEPVSKVEAEAKSNDQPQRVPSVEERAELRCTLCGLRACWTS